MANAQNLYEDIRKVGEMLAEKWSNMPKDQLPCFEDYPESRIDFLEGIEDPWKRNLIAILCENYRKLTEDVTTTGQLATFPRYVYPLIRAVYANIITGELFSVQPLTGPTGLVFYWDIIYGSTKGNVTAGSKMYDALAGPMTNETDYISEKINSEVLANGDGSANRFTGNLSWIPVRAGSVIITDGTETFTDNGNGNLTGSAGGSGTIDYVTGAYDITFNEAPPSGATVVADYSYNMEQSDQVPEVEFLLTSSPVVAQPFRLRSRWSQDAEFDLKAVHGIVAETEIVGFLGNEIQKEIYNKMIRQARAIAPGGYVEWDHTPPLAVPEVLHRQTLALKVVHASNEIFRRTQRFGADWIVCGVDFAAYIEALPDGFFTRTPVAPGTAGVHKIGTLRSGQVVYKDPAYPSNEALLGHKGTSLLDAGIIQAVYIGLYTTDTIRLDDFRVRKGLANKSAIKVVNPRYYQKMRIV